MSAAEDIEHQTPPGPEVPSLFVAGTGRPGELVPLPWAASQWGDGSGRLRGMAVSGALARACEAAAQQAGAASMRPARWRVDLFRVAAMAPCAVSTRIVRQGRRLCLIDAELRQGGKLTARGSALFLAPDASAAHSATWTPQQDLAPPPAGLDPWSREPRLYYSEGVGWTASPEPHQNDRRKAIWQLPVDVVEGERSSRFQIVAMAADLASVVTGWGEQGLAYVNADLDLTLARLPERREVGLLALHHVQDAGLATGSAAVFDDAGPLGTATVTAIARGQVIDPRARAR